MKKCLVVLGAYLGMRGSQEPTFLKRSQFSFGRFEEQNPSFHGKEFIALEYMDEDKTNKLNVANSHLREIERCRLPVLSNGKDGDVKNDAGGCLARFYKKLPDSKNDRFFLRIKKDGSGFTMQPIGVNTIRSLYKSAFHIMGIPNWDSLKPHALRAHFITQLANDDGVNVEETMAAARHRSVSASAPYQKRSSTSECNRLKAIGIVGNKRDYEEKVDKQFVTAKKFKTADDDDSWIDLNSVDEAHEMPRSNFTQIAMDGLRQDLDRYENKNHFLNNDSISSGNWTWNLPVERGIDSYFPRLNSRRQMSFKPKAAPVASYISRPPPSQRERHILQMRRQLQQYEEEDRMRAYPYRAKNPEEEFEII